MRLRALRLDRIGRLSAPLVAAALLLGTASFAPAQSERLPKVGYLGFGAAVPPTHFQNRMRELRYSEGKEVTVEYRFAGGRPGELPRLARELVDAKVDVIMAVGDEAIVAAKNATRTVPIVMVACDAVTTGFVVSLARPGGNLTGVTCITSELMPKRMAVFRELLPSASRLVVLYNPENVSKPPEVARLVELAKELGLDAKAVQFRTAEDIERAFSALATDCPREALGRAFAQRAAPSPAFVQRRGPRGRSHLLRSPLSGDGGDGDQLCRENPQRRETGRAARRAADSVRTGHQSEDR
jgi:putative ABC transport system substrate-binding protein